LPGATHENRSDAVNDCDEEGGTAAVGGLVRDFELTENIPGCKISKPSKLPRLGPEDWSMPKARGRRAKEASRRKAVPSEHTIAELMEYLCPGSSSRHDPPAWPPDAFAITGLLLQRAGGYRLALSQWPPFKGWEKHVRRAGDAWRSSWNRRQSATKELRALWKKLLEYNDTLLDSICHERELCETLLQIYATADAASYAVGLPTSSAEDHDQFYEHGAELLLMGERGSTLCESVHTTRVRVLPKMHTPQTGLTIRSFSHHLALCGTDEMRPEWAMVASNPERHRLNLLLFPWPYTIKRDQFENVPGRITMPDLFGCFEYHPLAPGNAPAEKLDELLQKSEKMGLRIDVVILPELSLTLPQYEKVSEVAVKHKAFLLAGVAAAVPPSTDIGNYVCFDMPLPRTRYTVKGSQAKHHRWRLDKSQIERYRLEKILRPNRFWWEHIPVEERCLYIFAMRPWLTFSVLICEDLARPDPAGEVLRAVGPNLVVALLLDGPQLPQRWSSRYAMALADDPGSSVLTLTSLGMAQLSGRTKASRTIGLWKDGQSGPVRPIQLPKKKEAVVLEINIKEVEEFTADGRSDGRAAGIPTLKAMRFL
jgi:hypothetical protein